MRSMFFVTLAACGVERMPNDPGSEPVVTTLPERGDSSDSPAFGQPGGGALEPVDPTEPVTTDDPTEPEDTAGEPVTTGHGSTEPEDTGVALSDDECWGDESRVTITYTVPVGTVMVTLSGMLEATYGGFEYVTGIHTGSPVGMTVTVVNYDVVAAYDVCTPDGSRWELSASYTDAAGATHWSCEGNLFTEHGEFSVLVDGEPGPEPTPVSNGVGGCEHEFWQ